MNCMNCGALLTDMDYCPHCGSDVMVQKKAFYLSNLYYNQGLEKASIRDLSGAIGCLRRSLTFNKYHMQARNLLGLVYFETGEVVSALSEWVISKNLNPIGNLAVEYIDKLQANPNKLNTISESIRKYNHALAYCREGHEDMAVIQLKKVLTQNPQLIKGYHLLALLQIREKSYGKARRTLKKAARIDKTNTTTLRFLREVDEQTGVTTNLDKKRSRGESDGEEQQKRKLRFRSGNDIVIQPPTYRENSIGATVLTFVAGILIGGAALWFLIVPAQTQKIHQEANEQIQEYSDAIASKEAQLESLQTQAANHQAASQEQQTQQQSATELMNSYDALIQANHAMDATEREQAVSYLALVNREFLSESGKTAYDAVKNNLSITDEELANAAAPTTDGENDGNEDGMASGEESGQDTGDAGESGSDGGEYGDGGGYEDSGDGGQAEDESGYYDDDGNYVEY